MLLHKMVIIEKEEVKQGEIVNPSKKSQVGIIKEVGEGLGEAPSELEEGARVVYYEDSVVEIEFDGKKEYVLDYDDIIKIID